MSIPVVDLFAGPGGLGEGFSALRKRNRPVFKIAISAEMEKNAARTLRLRAFFRQFPDGDAPQSYYDYVASGGQGQPWTEATRKKWEEAGREAQQLTIGEPEHDTRLRARVKSVADSGDPWVLIGGPPCQAYSLVGRSRNAGTKGYRPEEDPRFFLYRHYRDIVGKYEPAVFVMENVRGLLSAEVDGQRIFPRILEEMHRPRKRGQRYRIIPLVGGRSATSRALDEKVYLIRSEHHGIPQARHRVILLGIAEDLPLPKALLTPKGEGDVSVECALRGLPAVRSGLTDDKSGEPWPRFAKALLQDTAALVKGQHAEVAQRLREIATDVSTVPDPGRGGNSVPMAGAPSLGDGELDAWIRDPRLTAHLNHETREHMRGDLMRYAFAAAFAAEHNRSPRGHKEFPHSLRPDHKNWESGKFLNRFKVQLWDKSSSTITSHIAKDGHYFIHPDASQIRSLTVREAARLQTFPDNYFFEGKRGHQFHQVGNAVPPLLARQIAEVVRSIITS